MFESAYKSLVFKVLVLGEMRETRNSKTRTLFGERLVVKMPKGRFPLLNGRKIFHKGVFGELAAMLRGPKHIDDFKKWGCNYWDLWAKEDGSIEVDYGNAWMDQIPALKYNLANDPTNRRMLIDGWRPERLYYLDLPCCHYSYQFHVSNIGELNMVWTQRSVDVMVGLPSDIVFAYAWLIMVANEFGYVPGRIVMNFGDTHIYESHVKNAQEYYDRPIAHLSTARYELNCEPGKDFTKFEPSDIIITDYNPQPKLEFDLHA